MKIGDTIEYTDEKAVKHNATIVIVHEQQGSISDPDSKGPTLLTLEYRANGRTQRAELVSEGGNASGQCYGKVISSQDDDIAEDDTDGNTSEDQEPTADEDPKSEE